MKETADFDPNHYFIVQAARIPLKKCICPEYHLAVSVNIHVNFPFKTKAAWVTALAALHTSCCTKLHESEVFELFAFTMASSMPGYDFDP